MRKTFFALPIIIVFFIDGCSSVPSKTATSKPTSKQMIYMACIPLETQGAKERGENKPEVFAHYLCQTVAGLCTKEPEKESCQKLLKKYELELNKKGDSLLYQAAYVGDKRIVEAMINIGVNVDYPRKDVANTPFGEGWTPLLIAVAEGNEEVVAILIKNGANLNSKNKLGRTPLMFASNYGFYSIAKLLLENGANTEEISNDEDGWSAITAASYKGHDDIVRLLVSHGADTSIPDKNGKTALMWAEIQGNTKVVEILKDTQ